MAKRPDPGSDKTPASPDKGGGSRSSGTSSRAKSKEASEQRLGSKSDGKSEAKPAQAMKGGGDGGGGGGKGGGFGGGRGSGGRKSEGSGEEERRGKGGKTWRGWQKVAPVVCAVAAVGVGGALLASAVGGSVHKHVTLEGKVRKAQNIAKAIADKDGGVRVEALMVDPEMAVTVQPGDTLYSLAAKHEVSVPALQAANNMKPHSTTIFPGSRLYIPDVILEGTPRD